MSLSDQAARVVADLDSEYAIGVVEALCSRPSVSGDEAEVSRWTAEELRRLGLDVVEQEVLPGRCNVIATLDSGRPGPTLLFNGHLDTLPVPDGGRRDPYRPRRADGRLYGAEINNMKGAVGAMIAAVATILPRRDEIAGRIILSAVIGECDALGLGTLHMLESGLKADMAINGEPSDLKAMTCHSGVSQLRLAARGKSVHICRKSEGRNAIEDLLAAAACLDESILTFDSHPDFRGLPTLNVGVVRGGTLPSMLASEAEALIDVRTVPGMTPESVLADVTRAVRAARTKDGREPDVRVELIERPRFCQQHPYHVARDAPVVQVIADCHAAFVGAAPAIGPLFPQVFYGTDASHLQRAGISTIIYGPGKVEEINVPDESMAIEDLLTAARVYCLAAMQICARR